MTEQELLIVKIIAKTLYVDENEVVPNAQIFNDLNADSLQAVELVMDLEEALSIIIEDDDVERINTVQDVFDVVKEIGESNV
jgi:acyl carrier protein|tara:strand:- start:253 stop:498 length:246 start_codon:yes stop_codon:yes gene_type:complete